MGKEITYVMVTETGEDENKINLENTLVTANPLIMVDAMIEARKKDDERTSLYEPRWWMTEVWVDRVKRFEIRHLSRCLMIADMTKPVNFEEYDYDLGCFNRVIDRVGELVGE